MDWKDAQSRLSRMIFCGQLQQVERSQRGQCQQ